MPTFPRKLFRGAHVRVVAPSRSLGIVSPSVRALATSRLDALGLDLSFGRHVEERDAFDSSTVASRVADLHDAFNDDSVDAILTVLGGFNSNQLLDHLDYELIGRNPKIFCGYSDITALQGAMLARADLVTYSGPHYSTFGMRDHLDHTLEWFQACLSDDQPVELKPAELFTDDLWFLDQDDRNVQPNEGWWVVQPGQGRGRLVGGNLCTLNVLHGTANMPALAGALLFVEDDEESQPHHFDRDLQSLLHQPGAAELAGLLIGRFQHGSHMDRSLLDVIIANKPQLQGVPVIANVDFGHTNPLLTLPVGGLASVSVDDEQARIVVTEH